MAGTSSPVRTGHFQVIDFDPQATTATIQDEIYGSHTITEAVLVELLTCEALSRLIGVHQAGITSFLGLAPAKITRFEHSVGACLLVRIVGGTVEEQVTGLLHDISHTAFSHVVDYALSKPGEESFHEVHKMRYVRTTEIPQILAKHGFEDLKPLNEELYGLVERPSPHLCADRLDYGLRDTVAFGKLPLKDAHQVVSVLKAHPDTSSPDRMLVLSSPDAAKKIAKAYMAVDRDMWSHPSQVDLYKRSGKLIGDTIRSGSLREEQLWSLSDREFWEAMRGATDENGRREMAKLETEGLRDHPTLRLARQTKIRTIDPDVLLPGATQLAPLSSLSEEYSLERQEYIASREAMRDSAPS